MKFFDIALFVIPSAFAQMTNLPCVPPPANVAVAVNCSVAFTAIEGFAGVTAIDAGAAATSTTEVGL